MKTFWLDAPQWLAILRIALGAWWLESVRHKNLRAWIERHAGINWALDVASKHRWAFVRNTFERRVRPHPTLFTWVVLLAEASCGVGIAFGFLTPVALAGSVVLNLLYFTLMLHDVAEQGQNLMMMAMAVVAFGGQAWQEWSVDAWLGLFGT